MVWKSTLQESAEKLEITEKLAFSILNRIRKTWLKSRLDLDLWRKEEIKILSQYSKNMQIQCLWRNSRNQCFQGIRDIRLRDCMSSISGGYHKIPKYQNIKKIEHFQAVVVKSCTKKIEFPVRFPWVLSRQTWHILFCFRFFVYLDSEQRIEFHFKTCEVNNVKF